MTWVKRAGFSEIFLMDSELRSIIEASHLFRGLSDAGLDLIVETARTARFPRGTVILRQDQPCEALYCVGRGLVRVYKLSPHGKEHILHFAEPGKSFAEVAVIGKFNCPAYAEAVEDTLCAVVPAEAFHRLLDTNHELCKQFVEGMAYWVRQLVGLLEDIVLRDASGRLAKYLLAADPTGAEQAFALPIMKKDLASHLNLTSETLSRTLRRFSELGLIATAGPDKVQITNPQALSDIAEGIMPGEFA